MIKSKLQILIIFIACAALSFTWPKNQQSQMHGARYDTELKGKLKVDENAKKNSFVPMVKYKMNAF